MDDASLVSDVAVATAERVDEGTGAGMIVAEGTRAEAAVAAAVDSGNRGGEGVALARATRIDARVGSIWHSPAMQNSSDMHSDCMAHGEPTAWADTPSTR